MENREQTSSTDELLKVTEFNLKSFEFEQYTAPYVKDKTLNIKGSLKRHISFWKTTGTPRFILDVIERGYKLPFDTLPESVHFRNNKSAETHAAFVDEAISELVNSGRVDLVSTAPYVVNPLSVSVQSGGKKRLILDLRHVNKCLSKKKIKYEYWNIALAYFEQNAYMFSFDLKCGYHHIDIYTDHQTYLGFSLRSLNSRSTSFYVFTVLPFGLSTAPHIFTKVVKPLEKHWRYMGICIAIFLDDGWSTNKSSDQCDFDAKSVRTDLISAGFVPNDEKSYWDPTQSLDWLGLTWNSREGTLSILPRRIKKVFDTIELIAIGSLFKISARQLASFVGQIISIGPVIGNLTRMMTRHCAMSIASAPTWDDVFHLDDYCKREIYFWRDNLKNLNEKNCFLYSKPSSFAYSDASDTGCGSLITMNDTILCHKMWLPRERAKSSTWRELAAIEFAIQSFKDVLKASHVKWFTDNQAAAKITEVGSMHFDLHHIALRIFNLCLRHGINLDIQWIP